MEKSTYYLIIIIVVAVTILGLSGEYLSYKYFSILADKSNSQTLANTTQNNVAVQSSSASSAKSITSFNFGDPMAVGTISESNHTVSITVPPITDVTKLVPTIAISDGATVSPTSNTPQDFTNPVTYTVTAQNGSTQSYTVTVNIASILKTVGKSILSFKLLGLNPEVDGVIDNNDYTVYAIVPDSTDITALSPTIVVSDGATISPSSGSVQDFTNSVIYTVTDAYGGTQKYTVTVSTVSNSG